MAKNYNQQKADSFRVSPFICLNHAYIGYKKRLRNRVENNKSGKIQRISAKNNNEHKIIKKSPKNTLQE